MSRAAKKTDNIAEQAGEETTDVSAKEMEVRDEPMQRSSLRMHEFKFESEKIKKPVESGNRFHRELSIGQFVSSMMAILILGLIFLGSIYFLVNADLLFKGPKYQDPVTTEPISLYLEVSTPETDTISSASTVVVSGKTIPDAVVAIISPNHDEIMNANSLGEFSKVFPLNVGLNPIGIYAYDNKGNSKSEMVSVYYTTDAVEKDK